MRGKYVERRFGWDCHGLPVENEMEKQLNLSSKRDIEAYGIDKFNEACRSIVLRYTAEWEKVVGRMGRWVDFRNGYRTMDRSFMESIWWVFSSRMRLRIAGVAVMISKTGTMPPSTVGTSCWLTTACSTSDSCMRI